MNGPTAAVVIFFLLMCVKRLLLSLTPLLPYDTHAHKAINIIVLAGPALFRGRLRAFGKCTDVVASSKGRLNLHSVRLIV